MNEKTTFPWRNNGFLCQIYLKDVCIWPILCRIMTVNMSGRKVAEITGRQECALKTE